MLGLLNNICNKRVLGSIHVAVLQRTSEVVQFGPFYRNVQRRWKKPVDSAQVRLESRTRDLRLDRLLNQFKRLELVLSLHELISKQRGQFLSVQLLSKWRHKLGINVGIGAFLRKYPHIFELFMHPVKKNLCCMVTQKMRDLIAEEAKVVTESEIAAVQRLKKLLMMSSNGTLHLHAIWLIRRELGLPDDFRKFVLPKYLDDFSIIFPDTICLLSKDESLAQAEVDKWREEEYIQKWLSEFETRYAFPIHFPTGFKIEKGSREKLKNWQRLSYLKPYEKKEIIKANSYGGVNRFEKRAVGILHEFLSLTVEKMVGLERLSHFRRDLNIETNLRELLIKHPGIFYISTKGETQTVFLRDAYRKGCLINSNPVYTARRKMLELVLLGCRNTNLMTIMRGLE